MTARKYVEILSETFMIRVLQPWHQNISKRQVKAPKLYFRDSGILHTLLEIKDEKVLRTHPKLGASWEGFALEQLITSKKLRNEDCHFWSTHNHSEVDLLIFENGFPIGFEFKFSDSPKPSRTFYIATESLGLKHLYIVTPKAKLHKIDPKITVLGLSDIC